MVALEIYTKDPQASLDYSITWAKWLALASDTLSASSWTATAGITIGVSSFTDTLTTVWLSGGTAGTTYNVTNHITTAAGRQDDRTLIIKVQDR